MKQAHHQFVELVRSGPPGLFSRRDTDRLDDHAADGIAGASWIERLAPRTIVDVGSGGGVPGMQLAIELPSARIHLVESQQWKAEFLLTCARALDLDQRLSVHACRAEAVWRELGGRETMDVGTARALAAPLVVAEYLSPLVRVGGHLVLWSTSSLAGSSTLREHQELGLGEPSVHTMSSPLRDDGVLIAWPKLDACAARFPRRVGVATKRPLA